MEVDLRWSVVEFIVNSRLLRTRPSAIEVEIKSCCCCSWTDGVGDEAGVLEVGIGVGVAVVVPQLLLLWLL